MRSPVSPVSKKMIAIDSRFADCKFMIEANSYERFSLWKEFRDGVNWEEDCLGFSYQVGTVSRLPVLVCFTFAHINGHRVCFYYASSRAVDYKLVDDFLQENFKVKYDKTRWAHTDAMNFSHCLHALKEEGVSVSIPKGDLEALQMSVAALERYRLRAGKLFTYIRNKNTWSRRQRWMDSRYKDLVREAAPDIHKSVLSKMREEGSIMPCMDKGSSLEEKKSSGRHNKVAFEPSYKSRELTQRDLKVIEGLYDRKNSFLRACGKGDLSFYLGPTHAYVTTTAPLTMHRWQGHGADPEFIDDVVPAGSTLKVVMISRFQDFGLTDDLSAENGYHIRVPFDSADIKDFRWEP